jgi:hypothetical protein
MRHQETSTTLTWQPAPGLLVRLPTRKRPRTDRERLDWLEIALRDGLGVEVQYGRAVVGYCDAAGSVVAAEAEGSGPTLRSAIDDAIARNDAECAALDASAELTR